VGKKSLKTSPDTQLLEDVSELVFIEYYMLDFVDKHPEYSEEKWGDIMRKIWQKMSSRAQQFVISGQVKLPELLAVLIMKVATE
jgi:hypothetical protein